MVTTVLNEHGESPLILSKHVLSSLIYKVNSVGEGGHLCEHHCQTLLHHVYHCRFALLHIWWLKWLEQLVVSEVVRLIVGGVLKACHVQLYQFFFEMNK